MITGLKRDGLASDALMAVTNEFLYGPSASSARLQPVSKEILFAHGWPHPLEYCVDGLNVSLL